MPVAPILGRSIYKFDFSSVGCPRNWISFCGELKLIQKNVFSSFSKTFKLKRRFFLRRVLFLLFCLSLSCSLATRAQTSYPFQDKALSAEKRIDDLISRMTFEEKLACLSASPSIPRLGIRGSGHVEGLHGLALGGPANWGGKGKAPVPTTQFPQARGIGQTWDPALVEKLAAVEALESRYAFQRQEDPRGGIVVRAPNADLSRDPRWGRSEESYGEDPFLVGSLAVAFAKGLQGPDGQHWNTASLLKHFLANSNEDGRDGSSSDFDERLFHEYYAVPFRMGIEQGGAQAFMTAYNAWNHIPMTANPVLRDVVMKDWGFQGIICTDAGALTNMVTQHKSYSDMAHAVAGALHAGINQFLDKYEEPVREAYQQKLITEKEIDSNLRGVFRVLLRLGLLDAQPDTEAAKIGTSADPRMSKGEPWNWSEHKELARQVSRESIVLLKNEHNLLPLNEKKLKSVAVIGPYADQVLLDWYSGTPPYSISSVEGLRRHLGKDVKFSYVSGKNLEETESAAKEADVAIVILGNHPTCDAGWAKCPKPSDGKEAMDRKSLTLEEEEIAKRVFTVNKNTILILRTSFPYTVTWSQQNLPALLAMTHNSEEEGNALADVLFGTYNPGGRLTQTWPASLQQLPPMMDYDLRHGRTYLYAKEKPLYPFGFGLSYSTFKYVDLRITGALKNGSTASVTVKVKNTGDREGDEVVQLYVRHLDSRVDRPLRELKGFQRIRLKPQEEKDVVLSLPAQLLSYWNTQKHAFTLEKDRVELQLGSSSEDIRLRKVISVLGE